MPKRGNRTDTANPGMELREIDVQEQPEERKAAATHQKDNQEFMKTPVRHRSRAAASENKWDSGAAHQFQTPERHRSDLASLVFSPQTNHFASPGAGLASPDLVPLFQPSPKRTLLSPQQQSGVNSFGNIFQSPVRAGDLQASDFLRFETPSSKPRFGGLFSPSPVRGKRHTPGGQLRQRAVSLEARGWQLGGIPGAGTDGFGDVQQLMHGTEDDQEDLIKEILQSPGPKEVQQAADRPQTRSRSILAPTDPADRGRRPDHPHRRALDFSRADSVHQDFHSLTGKRLTRQTATLGTATVNAAEEHEQQQLEDALLQPQLPLIPLDLSECRKHNPNSPFKQIASTGVTPRRSSRRQQQQQSALDAVLVSPRSALDAAMAHITQAAMPTLLQTSNLEALQGLECLGVPVDSADALKGLHPGLLKPAFEALSKGDPAAVEAGTAHSTDAADATAASAMVPMVTLAAGLENGGAMEQHQLPLEFLQQQFEQYQQQLQAYEAAVAQNAIDAVDGEGQDLDDENGDATSESPQPRQRRRQQQQQDCQADSDSDYEGPQSAAATAVRTSSRRMAGSKRWNLRPHGKKQYSVAELQPSRRSRRLAGDTPDEEVLERQQESRSTPGVSGRSGKQQSRTTALQQQDHNHQELEAADSLPQQEQDTEEALQKTPVVDGQQQPGADQDATAAEEAATTTADEEFQDLEKPRTRFSSRRGAKQKGRKGGWKSSSKHVTDESGLETEPADIDGAATAAAGMFGLPPVTGLQQFLQSGGLLQLPNGVTVPIGMTPNKGGINLLGPNTPDDMRMAHMAQPYGLPVRSCNCKKSQCLKLYCDCFANNVFCNGCSCADCRNVESNHTEVIARRSQIQQRDPTAFTAKLATTDADTFANRKGCKCKKSHCLKKYCECFQMGVRCADLCKCSDCRNIEDGTNSLAKKLMPRTLHSAAAASGPSSTARLPHHQQFWPLAPGLSSAAAATPAGSAAMGLGSVLLRLPGGPNTPGSGQLMCLPIQSSGDQAAAAAAALAQIQGSTTEQPAAAGGDQNRVAKPLLPQFLQAAAAGVGTPLASDASGKIDAAWSQDAAAAGDGDDDGTRLLSDEELPTPDQQAALECAAQITAQQQQHHYTLASPASSSGGHSCRGDFNRRPSPARALNLDRMASQEGSVLRSNSLSSPISALQAFQAAAAAAAAGVSPMVQQQSPAAAGSSSAGGALHGSPRVQGGIGSASSKVVKQHRLASTSRADDHDMAQYGALYKQHNLLQQQPQQQQGILALVGAAAAAGPAGKTQRQQHLQQTVGVTTRRQLLQQSKHESDTEAALANSHNWARPPGRSLQPQALFGGAPAAAVAPPVSHQQHSTDRAAAAGLEDHLITPEKCNLAEECHNPEQHVVTTTTDNDISPVQPVVLGPNGPTVNLSQRALTTAMNQSALPSAAAVGAPGDDSSQAVGMLMTVIDEQGQVQYYFLPCGQLPRGTSPSADPSAQPDNVGIGPQEVPQPSHQQQQQQQSHYQLRRRPANPLQGTGLSQLPDDMIIDQIDQHTTQQQQPVAAAAAVTPGKQLPPSPSNGRCLRSSSGNAMNGSSPSRTSSKRATPVKRKAADTDEQQDPDDTAACGSPCKMRPSPSKLQQRLDQSEHWQQQKLQLHYDQDKEQSPPPPQQQHSVPARQVLLSPVKRTKGGGFVVLPPQQQQEDCGTQLSSQAANNAATGAVLSPLQGIPISPEQLSAATGAGVEAAVQNMQYVQQQVEAPLAAAEASQMNLQQQQPQPGMQLFVASTADGQQYLLQAPIGTDPATLMQPDGSVDALCLGALDASMTAATGGGGALSDQQQYGHPFSSPVRPAPLEFHSPQQQGFNMLGMQRQASTPSGSAFSGDLVAPSSGGSSGGRRPRELGAISPQRPKVMLSPRDTRTRDGSLFKFSPGCTTVFSPTEPKLGSSPSKSWSMT